jgi:hypothetical protein
MPVTIVLDDLEEYTCSLVQCLSSLEIASVHLLADLVGADAVDESDWRVERKIFVPHVRKP